jgi:O-antigen ligase/tetratricopeptide (TPR) repeat protein
MAMKAPERSLYYGIVAGLFLIPFIPFIVVNDLFFPFITGKNFAFRILVEILLGAWIILALRNPSYRPSFSWILVALAAFLGIIGLADLLAENPMKAFWSNFERMDGFINLLHMGAYFLIAGTIPDTKKLWFWLAHTSIGASVLMGIYGTVQLLGRAEIHQGGVRVDGAMGNATYLAVYMLFHIFLTLFFLLSWKKGWFVRAIYGLIIALEVAILFYTSTRGSILGLVGGIVLTSALLVFFERKNVTLRRWYIAAFLIVLIVLAGFWFARGSAFLQESPVFSRIANISLEDGATRFAVWNIALDGFRERPLLGWGQENFNFVFNKYYHPRLYGDEPWFDRTHNAFFGWLVEGGILGLLAYLSLFFALLYYLWFYRRGAEFSILEKSVFTGIFFAYSFHNLFVFDNLVSYILFFSFLAYVHSRASSGISKGSIWSRALSHQGAYYIAAPLAVLVVIALVYTVNVQNIKVAATIVSGLNAQNVQDRISLFKEIVDHRGLGSQETAEHLIQVSIQTFRNNATPEEKQDIFLLAQEKMRAEIERTPNDTRLLSFLGSLYGQAGQHEEAEAAFKRALEFAPSRQRTIYQLGFSYLDQEKYEDALATFKRAYDLELELGERFQDSQVFYAAAALYAGEDRLAEELLTPVLESYEERGIHTDVVPDDVLLGAYAARGQHDKVHAIWQHRVDRNPNNPNYRFSLAASLLILGRDAEAVNVIEALIELEPRFREQGELIIQEIRAGRGRALLGQ